MQRIFKNCFVTRSSSLCVFVLGSTQVVDEHTVMMGFQQWLASVTERIHLTMHYQFHGEVKLVLL